MTSGIPSKRTPVSLLDADVDACSGRREFLAASLLAALPLVLIGRGHDPFDNAGVGAEVRHVCGNR